MKRILQRIDEILARVPADSRYGRRVHDEIVEHLEQSAAARVREGQALDTALDEAVAAFGSSEELERVYYRDYVSARYLWSLIDREWFGDGRWLRNAGAMLLAVGVVLYQLLPTLAAYVGALAIARAHVNDLIQDGALARSAIRSEVDWGLPLAVDPQFGDVRLWGILTGIGLAAFLVGGFRSLRRLRLPVGHTDTLVAVAVAVAGVAAVLTAADPSLFADAFVATLYLPEDGATRPTGLHLQWQMGLGAVAVLAALAVWIFVRAVRVGVGDTWLLRQGAGWLAVAAASLLLMSHPPLRGAMNAMESDPDSVAPARLLMTFYRDITWFVFGALGLATAILRLNAVFASADRIHAARQVTDQSVTADR